MRITNRDWFKFVRKVERAWLSLFPAALSSSSSEEAGSTPKICLYQAPFFLLLFVYITQSPSGWINFHFSRVSKKVRAFTRRGEKTGGFLYIYMVCDLRPSSSKNRSWSCEPAMPFSSIAWCSGVSREINRKSVG